MQEELIRIPGERKFDPQFERKPSGHIILGGQEIAHTMQCKHCGGHFVSMRGSGIRRGFCMRCRGVTCGKTACDVCIPFEAKLEAGETQNASILKRLLSRFPNIINFKNL